MNPLKPPALFVLFLALWASLSTKAVGENTPGLPLPAFLKDAIFTKERTAFFEAIPSDVGAVEITASSNAQQGSFLGYVRTGFLAHFGKLQTGNNLTAEIQIPLGTKTVIHTRQSSFSILGPLGTPDRRKGVSWYGGFPSPTAMWNYKVSPYTELLDPLTAKEVTLSNAAGSMIEAYQFIPLSKTSSDPVPGMVRTASGYFVGFLRERSPFAASRLTWAQVARAKDWKFRLRSTQIIEIKPNTKIFALADSSKTKRALFLTDNPDESRITPVLYEPLLTTGLAGIVAELDAPKDDGFEPAPEEVSQPVKKNGNQLPKEVILDSINVRFLQWSQANTQLAVEYVKQERPVFRNPDTGQIEPGIWKKDKRTKNVSLQNDPDGGIRFTDRKYIYEITKEGFAIKFNTYLVEQNPQTN